MADKPAQERKRKASSSLRALAQELQIDEKGRNYDMSKEQFSSLLENVRCRYSTPDQRRRAEEAKTTYFALISEITLPPIPVFPVLITGASGPSTAVRS